MTSKFAQLIASMNLMELVGGVQGIEEAHGSADQILCDTIKLLASMSGDEEVVKACDRMIAAYDNLTKWYA